jgi:orotate phosphoribosyltransferase
MTNEEALALFQQSGALLTGHFLLSSGLHSGEYLEKFRLVENPRLLEPMIAVLAERFAQESVEAVVGPTTAGIILAYEVARHLGVQARYAEKVEGVRQFRRGQVLAKGTRVLVVDDILTTGGAVRECLELVEQIGARVVGVGVLGDRSGGTVDLGTRLEALLRVHPATYRPEDCPLCAEGVPLVKPGTSMR